MSRKIQVNLTCPNVEIPVNQVVAIVTAQELLYAIWCTEPSFQVGVNINRAKVSPQDQEGAIRRRGVEELTNFFIIRCTPSV